MVDLKDIDMGEFGRHLFQKLLKATATEASYADVMDRLEEQGSTQWEDEAFPPNEYSLIKDWEDEEVLDKVFAWRQFEWLRAHDIPSLNASSTDGTIAVFRHNVEPRDIKQGALGDCYFLSVLSVLSEEPERIMKLFKTVQTNDEGVYAMQICKNGVWKEVVVDDFFPCDLGEPAFSRANGSELWVMLIEKAWAKLHGSYERIEAGLAENVLRDLTGAPTEVFEREDPDLFKKMKDATSRQWVITASAGNTAASQQMLESLGLVGQHSYGCLGVIELTDMFNQKVQLVQLRNPWGSFEWQGDWADEDDEHWTAELRKKAGWTSEDDGTFFMDLEDFKKYFSRVQNCRLYPNYNYVSKEAKHKHGMFSLIRLSITGDGGHFYLTVNQTDERCFDRNVDYDYSWARMILVKIEGSDENPELVYVGGKMDKCRDVWAEFPNLKPGQYFVYVQLDWPESQIHQQFSVSSYGSGACYFLRDEAASYQQPDLLRQIFRSIAVQEVCCTPTDMSQQGAPLIKRYWGASDTTGYAFLHFENQDYDASYVEEATFDKLEGCEMLKPNKGHSYKVTAGPKSSQTVLIKQTDPYSSEISLQPLYKRVELGEQRMKQLCRTQGKETKRTNPFHQDQEVPVSEFSYKHSGGYAYLIVNNIEQRNWQETQTFQLQGLQIAGNEPGDSEVTFTLEPGHCKLIQLKTTAPAYSFRRSTSSKLV